MKYLLLIFAFCFVSSLKAVDVVLNSVELEPSMSDCVNTITPKFIMDISNAVDDLGGFDVIGGIVRDAECNVLAWWGDRHVDGRDTTTIPGTIDNLSTFPPTAMPFELSLHDITNFPGSSSEVLNAPMLASMSFDPSAVCTGLTDLGVPCSAASMTASIPTLGEWGLISLGLMLIIFGVVRLTQGVRHKAF